MNPDDAVFEFSEISKKNSRIPISEKDTFNDVIPKNAPFEIVDRELYERENDKEYKPPYTTLLSTPVINDNDELKISVKYNSLIQKNNEEIVLETKEEKKPWTGWGNATTRPKPVVKPENPKMSGSRPIKVSTNKPKKSGSRPIKPLTNKSKTTRKPSVKNTGFKGINKHRPVNPAFNTNAGKKKRFAQR